MCDFSDDEEIKDDDLDDDADDDLDHSLYLKYMFQGPATAESSK